MMVNWFAESRLYETAPWIHPMKKRLALVALLFCLLCPVPSFGTVHADNCAAVWRAESFRQMSREELAEHRARVAAQASGPVVEAICESTAALTYAGYRNLLESARQEYLKASSNPFNPDELYFFLQCGEDRVNLSPLAYHAFNLNRDEYGFIGESTLKIVWMSIGYLEIRDPDQNRSFMDAVNRILTYARKTDSKAEVDMYEDLLLQIEGFREDYMLSVEECS
jgi:hypothetical protein